MPIEKVLTPEDALEAQRFMVRVYAWMCLALTVTAGVAWAIASDPAVVRIFIADQWLFIGLLLLELVLVAVLAGAVAKMSAFVATLIFLAYAALNGLIFSVIFLAFTTASIATTFLVTAGTFGVMSAYGVLTKRDLTSLGGFLFMGLIGLVLATLVNLFFHNELFYWITTYVGLFIFIGLTAYDTQKIRNANRMGNEGTDEDRKEAILGALSLYLDFINLFLLLLRLLGRRK
jgi:uncharacterized protein